VFGTAMNNSVTDSCQSIVAGMRVDELEQLTGPH
jgi:hypothetical protein